MRTRLRRLQRRKVVTALIIVAVLVFAARLIQTRYGSPLTMAGPNLVPNADFAQDADGDKIPDGWTTAGVGGVEIGGFLVTQRPNVHSVFVAGANNFIKSPLIAVAPGQSYRVRLKALADDQTKTSATKVEVWFHWRDDRGTEFSVVYSDAQDVPFRSWSDVQAVAKAPPRAVQLAISIHPRSDDRIVIDQFELAQVGVYIHAWPDGHQAALALTFDYETAMGGLVHSRSDDPTANGTDHIQRGLRMREGADALVALFGQHAIRGTFYTNGYNFLQGNRDRRQFLGNPTFAWATVANRWPSQHWAEQPWFSADPYTDEQTDPAWYFGSQVAMLKAAGQDIESHSFAHFYGAYVTPEQWQADFAAWREVAAADGVAPATSFAFPWSSSAGMSAANWQVLHDQGIRSVTRTAWSQPRFAIADRTTYALRPLPNVSDIMVVPDVYMNGAPLPEVQREIERAIQNGGVIDVWAHTEEASTAEQRTKWEQVIQQASGRAWIAPVPEIVAYHQAVGKVEVDVQAEQPQYVLRLSNPTDYTFYGLSMTLPFAPARVAVDGAQVTPSGTDLAVGLQPHQTVEITLWPV